MVFGLAVTYASNDEVFSVRNSETPIHMGLGPFSDILLFLDERSIVLHHGLWTRPDFNLNFLMEFWRMFGPPRMRTSTVTILSLTCIRKLLLRLVSFLQNFESVRHFLACSADNCAMAGTIETYNKTASSPKRPTWGHKKPACPLLLTCRDRVLKLKWTLSLLIMDKLEKLALAFLSSEGVSWRAIRIGREFSLEDVWVWVCRFRGLERWIIRI